MTFRHRVVLLSAGAVALAVAVASFVTFFIVRDALRDQVDDRLRNLGARVQRISEVASGLPVPPSVLPPPPGAVFQVPIDPLGGPSGSAQLVKPDGDVIRPRIGDVEAPALPVDDRTLGVARGEHAAYFSDATVDGTHVRLLTTRTPLGALQLVRPLTEVDDTLDDLRLILILVTLGGVGAAAGLGLIVTRSTLRPVQALTDAAETVTRTQDLSARMPAGDRDELDRLGASFNTMLAALDASRESQRRLVADASHELRTPLTSVRTNIDLLARSPELDRGEHDRIVADAKAQLEELSVLVGDIVDLARTEDGGGTGGGYELEEVALDAVAKEAVERARRLMPSCRFDLDAQPCVVLGDRARLHRAIANLLDNAVKHGPPEGPVEVTVRGGAVAVRDHGPGISAEDVPHVFDRFYRSAGARGLPGSGLGLAIVRQAVVESGGTVAAAEADGGGSVLTMSLPVAGGPGASATS